MNTNANPSFFSKLMERRFFQFLGSYLLGAWALVQFIDWMAVRFEFSKYIPESALTFFFLMIPSAITVIYFHGKTGPQKSNLFEKIFIPLNIVVAVFLSISFYANRAIDEIFENYPERVTIYDENGNEIERIVPSSSNTRRIVVFPFVNKTKKEADQWQSFGLSTLLTYDIEQDNRLYAVEGLYLMDEFIDYGYDLNKEAPLSILRKIADDNYSDFFFTGNYEIVEGFYKVNVEAFSTVDGKSFFTSVKEGQDFFAIIDDISKEFKQNLSLPDTEKDIPLVDLPSSNLFTTSATAFKDYMNAISSNLIKNDPGTAISLMKNAIAKDPNCVECYSNLGRLQFRVNDINTALTSYENAIKRVDALPERQQLNIKFWNYYVHSQGDKMIALTKMWMEFYPNDYKPYAYLIDSHLSRLEMDKAKEIAKKAINVGHKGNIFTKLASIALNQGELDEAKNYYQKFQEAYPHRGKETKDLADIYIKEGDYQKARTHLEKLQVLNSNDESITRKLAKVEYYAGNPDKAIDYLKQALSSCTNTKDSVITLRHIETYLSNLGQINKAIQLKQERMQLQRAYQSPIEIEMEFLQFRVIDQYIKAGRLDEITKIVTPFMEENPSFPSIHCMARINFSLAVKDLEKTTEYEKGCREMIMQMQGATSYLIGEAFIADLKEEHANAVKYLQQFIDATNVKESFYDTYLIRFLRLNNQLEESKKLGLDYVKNHPISPDVFCELALAYQQEGNKKEAIANLEKALAIWKNADENYVPTQEARALLAELK